MQPWEKDSHWSRSTFHWLNWLSSFEVGKYRWKTCGLLCNFFIGFSIETALLCKWAMMYHQRCQLVQTICICPDICAFSVLHNRHCADICTICQKCQFEVRKGWQVLLLQSEAEDMHCKQADSATLKYLLLEFSLNNLFMVKCMVFMHRWCCRDHANYYMSKLQFDKYALLSRKGFCWEHALLSQNGFHCKYAPFWVCLVQTFTQTFRIWLRFCADIWTKNRRLTALVGLFFLQC